MTVENAILSALNQVHPFMLPEDSLLIDVNAMRGKPTTLTDLRNVLTKLEGVKQVVGISSGQTTKWRITDNGKAELASQ